ncbi:MAG: DNA-protecting protein DprA [Rickettsiaceae bacterium]|nr:DNA-protecting protein DprA [Rickettsiaceae bacterium]
MVIDYSQETINILRLIRSQNVGSKTFINIINFFGSSETALNNIAEFSLKGGRKKPIKLYSEEEALKELENLEKHNAKLVTYTDPKYSRLLLEIADFPPILTYKGNIELLNHQRIIAVVGARNCSVNGKLFASKLSKDLVAANYATVSGLARGIDTAVHTASIGNTIAVIAGGIDHIYPPENKKLFETISKEGLIIAELPIGSKPLSTHFPQRNRIIAGLSLATAVIEAGLKSGSLITANMALEQNRDLFAVPGFPLYPRCLGTNKLIKDGAYLLESSSDIISNITSYGKLQKTLEESKEYDNNSSFQENNKVLDISDIDRKKVINLLSASPIAIETLIVEAELPVNIIYAICLELELAGRITKYPGNRIALIY